MSEFRVVYKGDLSTEIEHLDSGSKIDIMRGETQS